MQAVLAPARPRNMPFKSSKQRAIRNLLPFCFIVCAVPSYGLDLRGIRTPVIQDGSWNIGISSISGTATNDFNPVTVELASQHLGAFGDLIVAEKTPVVQMDFVYGLHTQLSTWTVTNSASVDTATGMLRIQSGTNSAGTSGFTVFNTLSSRNTNVQVDLTPYNLFVYPGETVIFGAECSAATSFGVTINWNEDN